MYVRLSLGGLFFCTLLFLYFTFTLALFVRMFPHIFKQESDFLRVLFSCTLLFFYLTTTSAMLVPFSGCKMFPRTFKQESNISDS